MSEDAKDTGIDLGKIIDIDRKLQKKGVVYARRIEAKSPGS